MQVITWQAPSGATANITPAQEERMRLAGVWPKSDSGEEYCTVSHGLHDGQPTYSDLEIDDCCE